MFHLVERPVAKATVDVDDSCHGIYLPNRGLSMLAVGADWIMWGPDTGHARRDVFSRFFLQETC